MAVDASARPVRLLIPGPVPLSPACARELARPVEPHYGSAWASVHRETTELIAEAFGTTAADVFPIVGSGSTGLDAVIGNVLAPGDRVAVGVNGYFGGRLATIARSYGADVIEIAAEWGEPLATEALRSTLDRDRAIRAVIVTHVETSTGVANPIDSIAAAVREREPLLIVDAVSSTGAMRVDMDELGIDACVTASQKGLGAAAGLAPVAIGPRAWAAIERRSVPRGWYLDLRSWREYATERAAWHPTPVTMPTHLVRALRRALLELRDEGIDVRARRMRGYAARLRDGVRRLGLELLAEDGAASPVVTAIRAPADRSSDAIVRGIEASHGIRIAGGGLGPLGERVFRIGHMGPSTTERDIDDVLEALERVLEPRA